ncbi:DUF6776 family protein [Dokdonella sp.]|uniref:DUF6776 family protein n=1 Tax=Dokdonella sp. TaxID=2291710 RepID=UPI0031BD54F0|nr:hypothetical protein [Dokdonella sp.]
MPNRSRLVISRHDPARQRRYRWLIALAWLVSVLLVAALAVGLSRSGGEGTAESPGLIATRAENETLKRRVATLERSEQVARAALADVQQMLRDRDEELEGLRADLGFYARLVGSSQREGLAVQGLKLSPIRDSHAWNFTAILTQNFRRGDEVRGRLSLSVAGVANGKLATLEWPALASEHEHAGIGYAFKYFQRVSGTIMLPAGFAPNRVIVRAEGDGGRAEQAFTWADAVKFEEGGNVP